MIKINENDRVITIENNSIRKGTVKKIFVEVTPAVFMVEFDDGNVEKVTGDKLALEPKAEIKNNAPDGAKVITKGEYMNALQKVTRPENMIGENKNLEFDPFNVMLKSMTVVIVGRNIADKLFAEADEIRITKKELSDVIVENTLPTAVSESTNGAMSPDKCLVISLLSGLVLQNLVDEFFAEAEND